MRDLGSMLNLEYGEALPSTARTNIGFPVYGSNGVVGYHHKALVQSPGSVVGRKGSVGKVLWSDTSFWPIDTTYYVVSRGDNKKWLHWLLAWLPLEALDTSTGVPGLNRNDVYRIKVFSPPADEQQLIAHILDTLDTQIRRTEEVIAKLEQVKQGLLTDLLTRGIDENGELRPPPEKAPELYKDSPVGLIPREWDAMRVDETSCTYAGGTPPRSYGGYFAGSLPWVKSTEVNQERITKTEESISEEGLRRSSAKLVPAGTPVMAMYGATAGIVSWLDIDAATNQAVLAMPPNDQTDARWLYWRMKYAVDNLLALVQGSGQPNLSKRVIDGCWVSKPRGLSEQGIIAVIMDQHGLLIEYERRKHRKLVLQKDALMDDLLTGRVRVTPLLEEAEQAVG